MRDGAGEASTSERPTEPGGEDEKLGDEGVDGEQTSNDPRYESPPRSPAGSVQRSSSRTPPPRPIRSPRRSNILPTTHKSIHSLSLPTATSDPFLPASPKASSGGRSSQAECGGVQDAAVVWQEAIRSSISASGSDSALAWRASVRRNSGELFAASPPPEESPALSAASSPGEGGTNSEAESYVTADEDDAAPPAGGKGRSSRRTSRDDFAPPMPTILDNSPVMSRTLRSLRITGPDEIPVSFGYSEAEASLGAEDTDEEAPRSIRQLVRSHRNLSRSSSREFTMQDEERLSSRDAERQNEGLGLNLELFEGPLSRYTPAVAPLLTRRSSSVEATSGLSTPMDTPGVGATASYPFPSLVKPSPPRATTHERSQTAPHLPIPPLASPFNPPTSSPLEKAGAKLSLGQTETAPTRPRSSSLRQSPATTSWTSTPANSSPISREGSPAPSIISHRASDEGLARPRPRTAGASLSSSKSFRRFSSVFNIGKSRSTSGQSLREMAEGDEQRGGQQQSANDRPSVRRVASDHSSFTTAPEPSPGFPSHRDSPAPSSPFFPSNSPRKTSQPPLPSPRLASLAVDSSVASSQASPNGVFSPLAPSPSPNLVPRVPHSAGTWRSTMSQEDYDSLFAEYGPLEMRRQEVIWELAETERLFVEGLRSVMELFALPLRRKEGGWIKGMPTPTARLFDWASDIVYLHSQISAALQAVRLISPSPIVLQVAGVFLPFVSRLEIHQPYLIRFDAVNRMIEEMSSDPASDFGEFVRMQSSLPECRGMSLGSYLLKPIQRLMKYPLFFKQLAELTPPAHPDHFNTLDLLDSTDTVIRVMQEVKTREDEYEQVKAIASRLRGLPIGFQLARRDRRLLHQGQLRRVHVNERDRFLLEADRQRRSAGSSRVGGGSGLDPPVLRLSPNSSRPQSSVSEDDSGASSAGAYDAGELGAWPSPFTTPDSRHSTFTNINTADSSAVELLRPESVNSHASATSLGEELGSAVPPQNGSSSGPPPSLAPVSAFSNSMPVRRSSKRVVKTKAKESMVQVFVFSDLVIMATLKGGDIGRWTPKVGSARRKSMSGDEGTYKALETFGVTRVLGVADLSGKTEHDHLIKLDLLPLSASSERLTPLSVGPLQSSTTALYFTLQSAFPSTNSSPISPALSSSTARSSPTLDLSFQSRVQWLQAFEKCYFYSYRSLTQPSLLNSATAPITHTEHLSATDISFVDPRQGLLDTAALSKSPGQLYLHRFGGEEKPQVQEDTEEDVEEREAEREERVFWAGRLQKVRRESDVQEADLTSLQSSRRGSEVAGLSAPMRITSLLVPDEAGQEVVTNGRRGSR